jgi:pimeloyl-ACP methyl ester carboxylesterase
LAASAAALSDIYRKPGQAEAVAADYRAVLAGWPVPMTPHQIDTREGSTFVIECGPADGPPLVLLRGSQANAAAWLADVPLWAARYRLLLVDMIGEAGFSAPVRPPLDGDRHALWLDDVLAALGIDRAGFCGTSLGGWLALDYAQRCPGRATSLVLFCPAGIGRQKNLLLKALPLLLLGAWGKHQLMRLIFVPPPAAAPPEHAAFSRMMNTISAGFRPRVVTIPRLDDRALAALGVPILVIVGGRDVLLDSRETRDRLQRLAPQAEVYFVPDGYHYLPGHTARARAFLDRVHDR